MLDGRKGASDKRRLPYPLIRWCSTPVTAVRTVSALLAICLAGCESVQVPPEPPLHKSSVVPATAPGAVPSVAESESVFPEATAGISPGTVYSSEAFGWSVVLPPGWQVAGDRPNGTALARGDAIAEVLVGPASGLPLEDLMTHKVAETKRIFGVDEVVSEIVRLPAGEALQLTFPIRAADGTDRGGTFILYLIEVGDTQYVVSVRSPEHVDGLLADATALAESFDVSD